jgi:hypothetical protein
VACLELRLSGRPGVLPWNAVGREQGQLLHRAQLYYLSGEVNG